MSIPRSTLISNFVYVANDLNIQVLDDIIKKLYVNVQQHGYIHMLYVYVCVVCVFIYHICVYVYINKN